MDSAPLDSAPGAWSWPDDIPELRHRTTTTTEPGEHQDPRSPSPKPNPAQASPGQDQSNAQPPPRQRHYKPRQCRICLETVLPTFTPPSENLPGIFQSSTPNVTYSSPDGGRLLNPCKCKGTQKYVHEECLQSWRHADPAYGKRNYWQCPTCGYRYRLHRLGWGRLISSAAAQLFLTVLIMVGAVFVLGFIADPIISFCLDPYGTLSLFWWGGSGREYVYDDEEEWSWTQHFTKGFASLGLLSFFKVIFSSPIQFFYRQSMGGTRHGTGRERLTNTAWLLIIIGALSFLYAVWKGVRHWSRRTLEKAGERVMDVQGGNNDDDDDDEDKAA